MFEVQKVAEKRRRGLTLHARLGRRDKRGSPVEPQAIGMAWVLACRSVGARAALCILTNGIKGVFGTMCDFDRWQALRERGRQRSAYSAWTHPQYPRAEAEELHQPGAAGREESRTHLGAGRSWQACCSLWALDVWPRQAVL